MPAFPRGLHLGPLARSGPVFPRWPPGSSHPRSPAHLGVAGRDERRGPDHSGPFARTHSARETTAIYAHLDDGALRDSRAGCCRDRPRHGIQVRVAARAGKRSALACAIRTCMDEAACVSKRPTLGLRRRVESGKRIPALGMSRRGLHGFRGEPAGRVCRPGGLRRFSYAAWNAALRSGLPGFGRPRKPPAAADLARPAGDAVADVRRADETTRRRPLAHLLRQSIPIRR